MDRRLRRAPDAEWVLMYRLGLSRKRIAERLSALAARHPVIGEVRGRGVFWALELVQDQQTRRPVTPAFMGRIKAELLNRGLLPFIADNRIHVAPPAVVTPEEVRRALDIYDEALSAVN